MGRKSGTSLYKRCSYPAPPGRIWLATVQKQATLFWANPPVPASLVAVLCRYLQFSFFGGGGVSGLVFASEQGCLQCMDPLLPLLKKGHCCAFWHINCARPAWLGWVSVAKRSPGRGGVGEGRGEGEEESKQERPAARQGDLGQSGGAYKGPPQALHAKGKVRRGRPHHDSGSSSSGLLPCMVGVGGACAARLCPGHLEGGTCPERDISHPPISARGGVARKAKKNRVVG